MPKLIIDGIAVEVAPGTSVLEAARSIGIVIPHFCYHPALAIALACRLCAVKCLDGPVKGIQMSCALPAQDGMVVSTTDPEAVKMRSLVIEWLMINHPHDCPVCDEGGECLLQDYTIAGGHGLRRYQGRKRTFINQYLGEYIYHEMNRCIQCYRCARFYQEYAGGDDFGVTGSGGRIYFGRVADGPLESPFSGNLLDVCPTGVFTDKTGRFRARYWDYEMAQSLCPHCSMGCNLTPQCYQRELIKIAARRNDQVNGWFICDRGRFGKSEVNDAARPRTPKIGGAAAVREDALKALAEKISAFVREHGAEKLALVGSERLSLEGGIVLARLARYLHGSSLCYFEGDEATGSAAQLLNAGNTASPLKVAGADCIAILGCDLMEQAPMLALSVRQAWLKGGQVFLVGKEGSPARGRLPFRYSVLPTLDKVPLAAAQKGVIICYAPETDAATLKKLAAGPARLALLQRGPNSMGAALLARDHGAIPLSEALAKGVTAAVTFESDLGPARLSSVKLLGAADWRPTAESASAEIFLPTTAWVESEGTWVNYEGRAQRFKRAMRSGLPLKGLETRYYAVSESAPRPLHPPRIFRKEPPGGEAQEAWRIAARLFELISGEQIEELFSGRWEALRDLDADGGGVVVLG